MYTHKIGERVQLCTHQAALLPPPRDHAVEEIKQQAEWHECQSGPQVTSILRRSKAVAHGELDRHDAAEAIHEGDEVRKVVGTHQTEVAWVLGLKKAGLFVLSCRAVST